MARLKAIDSPLDVAAEHRAVAEKVVKSRGAASETKSPPSAPPTDMRK